MSLFDLKNAKRLTLKACEHLLGQRKLSDKSAEAAVIIINQQIEYREAAIGRSSFAAKQRIQHYGHVRKALFAICEDLESHGIPVTWHSVYVIMKDDADRPAHIDDAESLDDDSKSEDEDLFAISTLWFEDDDAHRQGSLAPNGSLMSKLFDARKLDIRIQEVRESTKNPNQTKIFYITRYGDESHFIVKTLKNIVGDFLNPNRRT